MMRNPENLEAGNGARHQLLRGEGLSKSYAGVHALRDVSLDLQAGEVQAIVGECLRGA